MEKQLEDEQSWDFDAAVAGVPPKVGRVVCSVAFQRREFDLVAAYAERVGKRTSQFIREAAMEKAAGGPGPASFVYASGSPGTIWAFSPILATSAVAAAVKSDLSDSAVVTY